MVEHTRRPNFIRDPGKVGKQFLRPGEAEALMGLPKGYTDVPGVTQVERMTALGNGVDIHSITHLLRHFRIGSVPVEELRDKKPGDGVFARPIQSEVAEPLTLRADNMSAWLI